MSYDEILYRELASLPKPERKRVSRSCYHKTFRHWQAWVALAVCGLCGGMGAPIGKLIFGDSSLVFICFAVGGGIGGFIFGQVTRRIAIPYIREELTSRSRDVTC